MTGRVRSELLKLRSTRTTLTLLGWLLGVVALVVVLHVLSFTPAALSREDDQLRILGLGTALGALFAALLGALSVTTEFRTGTIRPTLLATPRRTRVIAAKLLAGLLAGLAAGLLAEALAAAVEATGLAARGIGIRLGAADYVQLLAGGALAGALFGAIGVGVGAVVRSQVAAIAGLCVWLLLVEPLLLGDVPSAARYAPEASAGAIAGAIQSQTAGALVAPLLGGLLLAVYAGLAGLAGALALERGDVD